MTDKVHAKETMLTRRDHISELVNLGDYVVVAGDPKRVVLNCPVCGVRMYCPHAVECEEPLTLSPSVVGPMEKVQGPCGHHYFIQNGTVQ